MPTFQYAARDTAGRRIQGAMEAENERAVAASLDRLGYHPLHIALQEKKEARPASRFSFGARVDRQEVIIVLRELASLLKAGIPLASCLESIAQQCRSPGLRRAMEDIARRVNSGSSLSEAFSMHPGTFSPFTVSMLRVGETAGILDQSLDQLARLGAREMETRSRVRGALVYPVVLVVFALLIVNGLLIGVLPRFIGVFQTSEIQLPWPTRLLLGLSGALREYWWLAILGAFGLAWLFRLYYRTPAGRWNTDAWMLRMPIVGGLYRKIQVTRIMHTLGSMLRTGVPLLEALAISEQIVANRLFQKALNNTRLAVAEGKSLSEPLTESGLFPHLVLQFIRSGEKAGQLDAMLVEAGQFYEPEIDVSIRNLTTLLEPILLLFMGVIVGFIALSVLLPIFQLIHVFRN